ncbi:MAG: class I SAM-dependent methyltransferase [Candidatus Bathyarchaeota archaeon]|nr:class I SAM-dependent methyltransferase [Candidatus Bathyarchaeota archaeon]
MEKPDFGNWAPQKVLGFIFIVSVVSYLATFLFNNLIVNGILKIGSLLLLGLFLYLVYVYWLLEKDDKSMQRQFWNLLIEHLKWDGNGKALDIGTGSGPIALLLAAKYPSSLVKGIDYWGEPWTYSKQRCERNAEIMGVSDRVSFEKASAVDLPFGDGEFDAVLSNFVFHSIRSQDRTQLIAEALRVLRDGGSYAFQDLFNDEFYGDDFLEVVKGWGLREVNFVESSEFIDVPLALRFKHMTGGSGILYGIK